MARSMFLSPEMLGVFPLSSLRILFSPSPALNALTLKCREKYLHFDSTTRAHWHGSSSECCSWLSWFAEVIGLKH